eukprot:6187622-Pleurochrysis_carterae.AAC.1
MSASVRSQLPDVSWIARPAKTPRVVVAVAGVPLAALPARSLGQTEKCGEESAFENWGAAFDEWDEELASWVLRGSRDEITCLRVGLR